MVIVTVAFIVSLICLFTIYHFLNNYIIDNMNKQSSVIYEQVVNKLGNKSFNYSDEKAYEYLTFSSNKQKLSDIRNISTLNSLYILKKTNNKIVYIVSSFNSYKDCYGLGNEIDSEIVDAAKIALSGNAYFSDKVVNINDQPVILSIYPVYDYDNNLIGAVGMEFNAEMLTNLDYEIRHVILPLIIVIVIILIILCFIMFNKTINDIIEKLIYTDKLTNLKNRLAYEKEIESINNQLKENNTKDPNIGILIYDLNDLKTVNDSLGHLAGDKYISDSALIINNCFAAYGKTYRIGGDEFVTILKNNSSDKILQALTKFESEQEKYNLDNNSTPFVMSIAVGYDYFLPGTDLNLTSVIKRADEKMYKVKKEKKRRFDRSPR